MDFYCAAEKTGEAFNGITAKFGAGKDPKKKAFKQALQADDGILGKKGFVVAKILSEFSDMDFYCAAEKTGEAFNGECAMVVCEWTGASTAEFHLVNDGLKEEKYMSLNSDKIFATTNPFLPK